MKEKKNKRKQNRKILPAILAIVALVSMLAVSASAAEPDCGCTIGDYGSAVVEFYQTEVTDYWKLECETCGEIRYYYEEGSFDQLSNLLLIEGPCDEPTSSVTYIFGDEDGQNIIHFSPVRVDGLPTNLPSDNKGMVGKMVSAITTSVTAILAGIGSSVVGFFDTTVLTADGQLSTFAVWLLAFLGIAFALGVVKFITNLIRKR